MGVLNPFSHRTLLTKYNQLLFSHVSGYVYVGHRGTNAKLECGVKQCVLVPHDRPRGEGEAEAGEPSDRDAGLTCERVAGRKKHRTTQKGFEKVSVRLMGSPGGRWSPGDAHAGRLSCFCCACPLATQEVEQIPQHAPLEAPAPPTTLAGSVLEGNSLPP